jgi:hypothetical protein
MITTTGPAKGCYLMGATMINATAHVNQAMCAKHYHHRPSPASIVRYLIAPSPCGYPQTSQRPTRPHRSSRSSPERRDRPYERNNTLGSERKRDPTHLQFGHVQSTDFARSLVMRSSTDTNGYRLHGQSTTGSLLESKED